MKDSDRMHSQEEMEELVRTGAECGYSKVEVEALVEEGEQSRSFVRFENGEPCFYTPLTECFPDEAELEEVCRAADEAGMPAGTFVMDCLRKYLAVH
ncbi:MAG TPA: hypothetical protein VFB89_13145 [Gemmatimonadales bacterium]|nr:hypothetical protein [Gemmatimonadales bacterium]